MRHFSKVLPFISLLISISLVMVGSTFLGTLVGLFADRAAFTITEAGLLGSGFYIGILASSLSVTRILALAGHIRTFATLTSLLSAATLAHAYFDSFYYHFSLRLIEGFALCGLYVCVESWLNDQSDFSSRGLVMSAYTFMFFLSVGSAQYLLLLDLNNVYSYGLASIILSVALIPVALTKTPQPPPPSSELMSLTSLFRITPVSVLVVMLYGVAWSSYFGLMPYLSSRLGIGQGSLALMMSFPIFGIVIMQAPISLTADRLDRRLLLTGLCFGMTIFAFLVSFIPLTNTAFLITAITIFGGCLGTLYPMAVAHASDRVPNHLIPGAISCLLLFNGLAAAIGPIVAPLFMGDNLLGDLFTFIACLGFVTSCLCLLRWRFASRVSAEDVGDYQLIPQTPTALSQLSLRAFEDQYSFDFDGDGYGDGGPCDPEPDSGSNHSQ